MSMWQDLFDIYQSVQSDETTSHERGRSTESPTAKATQPRTVYIFAYLDDGEGNSLRSMPIQERLTLLELRQQELAQRLQELEDQLDELEDE